MIAPFRMRDRLIPKFYDFFMQIPLFILEPGKDYVWNARL